MNQHMYVEWDLFHYVPPYIIRITIDMPQRTSKILLIRITANENALLFLNTAFSLAVNRTSKNLLIRCGICIVMQYTVSPLEKKNDCGSFIFISYWLISDAILSIS